MCPSHKTVYILFTFTKLNRFLLFSSGIGWCSQLRTETAVVRETNTDRNRTLTQLFGPLSWLCSAFVYGSLHWVSGKASVRTVEDHAEGYIRFRHAEEHKGTRTNSTHFGRTGATTQVQQLKPCSHSHAQPLSTPKSLPKCLTVS